LAKLRKVLQETCSSREKVAERKVNPKGILVEYP